MGEIREFNPKYRFSMANVYYFGFLHAMALLAVFPFAFSWSAVAVMLVLNWMTASLGICLGFHRYLTHRSFEMPKWLAYFFVFVGTLACQNGPIKWVGQHRMHHANSDTDGDPHSAARGFWWSHMAWMFYVHSDFDDKQKLLDYTKDFNDDKFYQFLDNHFIKIQIAFGCLLFAIGGLPWVIWGIFVRVVLVYHQTWLVNSASHMFGYKNFKLQKDLSTNCWWVGMLAFGEGWHNNHHAFPSSARHGLHAWEIDPTWMVISLLRKLGLATNLKVVQLQPKESETDEYYQGEMVKQAA
ncbi:Delta-9 desaturase [Nitrospina gracilis 3/211]|uniref:Delta-9 desaturase n=1 Tax=Nitrospina gracilis (strain 3/211) TaxID=1266370 RepID=M1ZCF0_NITG3|nr:MULTISPECIES: fatty acid desaturase [Nitrospina]MCF8723894.1 stearoyl-CoA desaturase (delta-9 desaturase) [Nitrospina sp. Nb-3]CCQ91015.1 Delta-9 desaturase [Nitrospina gracilis 3/211]